LHETKQISGLKQLSFRKYAFQKQTEFSQVNNVQDDADSNTHGFLWRVTCVSSSQLNRPIMEKTEPTSTMKHLHFRKYFIENFTQFSEGNNVLDAAASNIVGFLCRDMCVSSTELNSPNRSKHSLSTP
jgi:hypothetical protein